MDLPLTDPVALFALVAVLILLVPLGARWLRIPGIVGLILAGVAVGPHALKLLDNGPAIGLLGSLGMLYILFLAGLEIDLRLFQRQRYQSLAFGLITFLLAEGLGVLLGRQVLGYAWDTSILFGSLFASQTLLTYPLVSRLGLARNRVVATAIGGTLVTDFAALLVLALVARQTTGQLTVPYALQLLGGVVLLILCSSFVLPRLGRWFFRHRPDDDTTEFLFLLASLLAISLLSVLAGLKPIFGAFLAGLALNRLVPDQSRLMNRVQFVGRALFIPIFLLTVGMAADLRVFAGGRHAWFVAGLMVGTVIVAKLAAVQLAARLFKYSRDQAWLLFGMVINKAAFTLAAVLVGYQVGLLNAEVLNGTILMILVSCLIGPWITEAFGRRLALEQAQSAPKPAVGPQRILVPLANPQTADALMDVAFLIRDRRQGQPVYPLTVALDGPDVNAQLASMERMLSQAVVHAAAADVPVRAETRVDSEADAGIVRAIKELRASCVILGWGGRPVAGQVVFGSVLDRVLSDVTSLLLVCNLRQPMNTFQRLVLVVPPLAAKLAGFEDALRTLKTLASHADLELVVVCMQRENAELAQRVERTAPRVSAGFLALDLWSALWPTVTRHWRANDLLVFVNCRFGSVAWQPGLDRLPPRFVQQYPQGSLLVVYPADTVAEGAAGGTSETGSAASVSLAELLEPHHVVFGLVGDSHHEAIQTLVRQYLASRGEITPERVWLLAEALSQSALDLVPGAILIHVHCETLEHPVVLLGTSDGGLRFPQAPHPVHAVFALLSPTGLAPEDHLRCLSELARTVLGIPDMARLGRLRSLDELRVILTAANAAGASPAKSEPDGT